MHFNPDQTALCDALIVARRNHQPLVATAAHAAAVTDADAACALQHATGVALGAWGAAEMPRHWKSGAGSREATLVHAPLLTDGVRHSVAGQVAALNDLRFFAPGIESEIALRLGCDVGPAQAAALTHDNCTALIAAMAVSIEVVDSRWQNLAQVPPLLKLADFQVHGALVLGEWTPWRGVDWSTQRCVLQVGDAPPIERRGTHPLGTPQWLLPIWLRHLTRHGATVPAGTIVTTGTWTGLTPAQPADTVTVQFDGIGSASTAFR